ncbi:MAG: DUF3109 family protein [Bacteroidales bacterium]|jgi:hypothetical protein|nr:DUF3109 family protein [Bacteroidales bacterium]MDD4394742.1 DUF3109 family protein [Bacteroidales bacterium]
MLIVGNVLVSEELITDSFCCDLAQCGGMCCIEGDLGAPIEPDEIGDLEDNYPIFKKYMTDEGIALVDKNGTFDYDPVGDFVTPLLEDEACAFVYYEEGIAKCAIEKAFLNHEIAFQKPISCHLYPIRIKKLPDYDALNYHRWLVCDSACQKGKEVGIPLYKFLKEPLIRKYGELWYDSLEKEIHSTDNK